MNEFSTADWTIRLKYDSHPREVVLEVSTYCEFKCIHCFRWSVKNFAERYMKLEDFGRILENVLSSGVERVTLTGWGEPTLHPDFENLLKILKKRGLYVVLNTNGFKLPKIYRVVAENVDELAVSIDAATLELYSKIRVGGIFSDVVEGLRRVIEIKRHELVTKPYVKIVFTVTRLNPHEAGELLKLARDLGVNEVVYSSYIPLVVERELDCATDIDCVRKFDESLERAKKLYPEFGVRITTPHLPVGTFRQCPFAASGALYIRVDGAVAPCIYYSRKWETRVLGVGRSIDEVVLGNALVESLLNIWRSKYSKLYYKLCFGEMPSCFTCKLVDYCALTWSNESDCLGNSPTCAHCPFYHGLTFCPL
ncbi:MAG: radical SAM protein [Sulfolobales archaeon]|nr:radical SAM protein [Sulfolobales archaeon]MDW8082725.1 radical SAM protein [Sulfolobales archaeon]